MCQNCIAKSLDGILSTAQKTLLCSGVSMLHFEPVYMCDGRTYPWPYNSQFKKSYVWPADTVRENNAYTRLLRVLSIIKYNLENDKVCTVRDMYYQDVEFFKAQKNVSTTLEKVQRLLGVSRRQLNVVPSPNGLVAGDLTIVFDDDKISVITRKNGATLIPVGSEIKHIIVEHMPDFILIVEKEAVFTHLHWELENAIVLTGKGFPDHYTREFLIALSKACPGIPIFGLVDSDVHGLLIFRTHEAGGQKTTCMTEAVKAQWLGVSILEYEPEEYVSITRREMALSMSMLRKSYMLEETYKDLKVELQRGLFLGKKAEMNLKDTEFSGRLAGYVRRKIEVWRMTQELSV